MTETIYTYLFPLPMRVKGYTVYMDDVYTVVINSNLCQDERTKAYKHEIEHIKRGDFCSHKTADQIEKEVTL